MSYLQEDKYEEALIWYDFSKQCFSKSDQESKNIAKLQVASQSIISFTHHYQETSSIPIVFTHFRSQDIDSLGGYYGEVRGKLLGQNIPYSDSYFSI